MTWPADDGSDMVASRTLQLLPLTARVPHMTIIEVRKDEQSCIPLEVREGSDFTIMLVHNGYRFFEAICCKDVPKNVGKKLLCETHHHQAFSILSIHGCMCLYKVGIK